MAWVQLSKEKPMKFSRKSKVVHLYTAPTNTTTLSILIITMLINLACLQTAMISEIPTDPAPTKTAVLQETSEPESGAVFEPDTWNVEPETQCAIVTAVQALNLRAEPSEKANVTYWLPADKIVKVIGRVGDWWKVEADNRTGYARADYLQETECE